MGRVRAVGLLSGGLDSLLAAKLMLDQGVDVYAVNFTSPIHGRSHERDRAEEAARALGVPLKKIELGSEYLRIIRNPKYGYGSGMNPCIDCHAFMLRMAKRYARQIDAKFIFTGEVLGERPMSQNEQALRIVEKEAGLEGKVLRPLSAQLLPETEAERRGWVDRSRLLSIRGRSRRPQLELAKTLGLSSFPMPSGGCLLTEKEFVPRIKDLFAHRRRISLKDILLLRVGRHFRLGDVKVIVGRNEGENKALLGLDDGHMTYLEPVEVNGPIALLQGRPRRSTLHTAAGLTARYCDGTGAVLVKCRRGDKVQLLRVERMSEAEVKAYIVAEKKGEI
ncbi:MAG: 7-cyano-7-deazaguanine synthase [Candidatus Bathyarchaeia archaeon]